MDIAFARRTGWYVSQHFHDTSGGQGEGTTPDSPKGLFHYDQESLRRNSALYREVAEIEPTEAGALAFLQRYTDLGAEPQHLVVSEADKPLTVFSDDHNAQTPKDRAIVEVLVLHRCVRLWDMVQRNDQVRLARYIKRDEDAGGGARFTYDSHPDLPAGQMAPPPENREVSIIEGSGADAGRKGKIKADDLRPAARAYLAGIISKKLEGGLNARVVERPRCQGRMEVYLVPRTFLAALWLQFMEEVTGNFTCSQCLACQTWFRPVKHRDRMYCANTSCKVKAFRIREKAEVLLEQGLSLSQAAEELKIDESVLRKLLNSRRKEK